MWYSYKNIVLSKKEKNIDSAIVLLKIPKDVAAKICFKNDQIEKSDIVDPKEMHLTLLYFPELHKKDISKIKEILQRFFSIQKKIDGKISGIGAFNRSKENDNKLVLYASYDAIKLPSLRQNLLLELNLFNIYPKQNHGFTPHISLAYLDDEKMLSSVNFLNEKCLIEEVQFRWGDETVDTYKLK